MDDCLYLLKPASMAYMIFWGGKNSVFVCVAFDLHGHVGEVVGAGKKMYIPGG